MAKDTSNISDKIQAIIDILVGNSCIIVIQIIPKDIVIMNVQKIVILKPW